MKIYKLTYITFMSAMLIVFSVNTVCASGSLDLNKAKSTILVSPKGKMDLAVSDKQDQSFLNKVFFSSDDKEEALLTSTFTNHINNFTTNKSFIPLKDFNLAVLRFTAYLKN